MLLLSCSQLSRGFDAEPLFDEIGFELNAGQHGNAHALDAAAWHERRARLEKLGGPPVE